VMMYESGGTADAYCRAVRERDVIVDEFTVTLRDACGAEAYSLSWSPGVVG